METIPAWCPPEANRLLEVLLPRPQVHPFFPLDFNIPDPYELLSHILKLLVKVKRTSCMIEASLLVCVEW